MTIGSDLLPPPIPSESSDIGTTVPGEPPQHVPGKLPHNVLGEPPHTDTTETLPGPPNVITQTVTSATSLSLNPAGINWKLIPAK